MALVCSRPASLLLIAALLSAATFLAVPAAATGKTGQVAVFWGRNKNEGSLREACDTGTYTIAIISFLDVFGRGNYHLDLSGHDVSAVGADIKHCQSKNGAPANYDELAKRLWNFNKDFRGRTPVQLTATLRCGYPDRHVERALATGLVGRIFVRFYDDAVCAANWQRQWDKWTAAYPSAQIYLGLPASEQKVGYVHPKNLYYSVIQVAQKAANYGGVMVWERYEDKRTNYSSYAIQWA
ncbi:unnamed protein product [Triticum turgidum subsp. durum]|uniref:GH18 domain-containing protein n=1 Tax=Triticum turgidum subsp. durum TaxID=4567 RepID=A0A9R0T012_TRITD|nr:unnamed protein product [Triticum turgidum subsp. durum]